ncbi:MAG: hypothetical protein ACYST0_10130, partial [Planctomycetota bacterium]
KRPPAKVAAVRIVSSCALRRKSSVVDMSGSLVVWFWLSGWGQVRPTGGREDGYLRLRIMNTI